MYICVDVCIDRVDGCVYAVKKIVKPVLGSKDEQRTLREVYAHALMGVDKHVVRYICIYVCKYVCVCVCVCVYICIND